MNQILLDILSITPNAPTLEEQMRNYILKVCKKHKIPCHTDKYNNVWVNATESNLYTDTKMLFTAHLDHPGIVINKIDNKHGLMQATWLGGKPAKHIEGYKVRLFLPDGEGYIDDAEAQIIRIDGKSLTIAFFSKVPLHHLPMGATLDLDTVESQGIISTRSADDLISVSAIIEAIIKNKHNIPKDLTVLFSHSEEIGLRGVRKDVIAPKLISKDCDVCVFDVTRSAKPVTKEGTGLIMRTGDDETNYPCTVNSIVKASGILPVKAKKTKGATEATAFVKGGFPKVASVAIAIYAEHNKESDTGFNVLPESFAVKDYEKLVNFISFMMKY